MKHRKRRLFNFAAAMSLAVWLFVLISWIFTRNYNTVAWFSVGSQLVVA